MKRLCNVRAKLGQDSVFLELLFPLNGIFNKKEDYNPRKISKSEDQVDRIKAKILQSFLFHNLDSNELDVVINAMEERKFE
jgi:hypothetical protein